MSETKKKTSVEKTPAPVEVKAVVTTPEPEKEVQVVEQPQSQNQSVEGLISLALKEKVPVESLERLFSLREKVKAEQAKEAFVKSMADLQSELPVIKKLKEGHVAKFAPLEDVVEVTKPFIRKHGFSYRWNTSQTEKNIKVVCIATHTLGHSEETDMTSEVEETVTGNASGKATKSAPQRVASTITFLKRYTFINLFGVVIAGEDFDGRMEKQTGKAALPPTPGLNDKAKILHLLKLLKAKAGTKEEIAESVKSLVQLDLIETNFVEIVSRLEVLVSERNDNEK